MELNIFSSTGYIESVSFLVIFKNYYPKNKRKFATTCPYIFENINLYNLPLYFIIIIIFYVKKLTPHDIWYPSPSSSMC